MLNEIKLTLNQPIVIKPESSVYQQNYSSHIIGISEHTLTISIPYDQQGKLVPLGVGTILTVEVYNSGQAFSFQSEIIGRTLGATRSITIIKPSAISRLPRKFQEGMSKVIAVTSGKGGVGKTSFTINLAIALARLGKRVAIIDADLGTANVDVLLRLDTKFNLAHLVAGEKEINEIIVEGPAGIKIIPGGSGIQELTNLSDWRFSQIISSFNQLEGQTDLIFIDTGAGISKDVSNFLLAADEVIVVTTPEPHAIADAYAIIKVMVQRGCNAKMDLVLNKAETPQEAQQVAQKMDYVTQTFLHRRLDFLGYILEDYLVSKSLKEQVPLLILYPYAKAAGCIKEIAKRFLLAEQPLAAEASGGINAFFNRMKKFFDKRS